VPSEWQLPAVPTVGFGDYHGFTVVAIKVGFQPTTAKASEALRKSWQITRMGDGHRRQRLSRLPRLQSLAGTTKTMLFSPEADFAHLFLKISGSE
jgi:hypothetical protein